MKRSAPVIIFIIISVFICGLAFSQEPELKKVKLIRVKQNRAISTAVIVSKIKTKVGDTFSHDVLNDDLKRLYSLGFFTDISIDVSDHEDGVAVTFFVEEKPIIKTIEFKGNASIKDKHLKKEMSSKEGEMLDPGRLSQDAIAIKKYYEKRGFHLAELDYSSRLDEETNTATVTFVIDERLEVKIKHIFLEGNESYPDKKILRLLTTRPDTLFTSGYFKRDVFDEDVEKLKAFYQNEGHLDVAIDSEFEYYDDNKNMDVTVIVDEGKKYLVGDIYIAGNTLFEEGDIKDAMDMTRNKAFSQSGIKIDAINVQEMYYNRGYIMCRVYPEPTVNKDTGRIDVKYSINEDKLIYVDKIKIAGNTKTKDIVIRRELRIYPGEPFNGAMVKRSKERLYNLGYFEEIAFNTEPTEDPSRHNLIVNVKETKTGEFSFGGGYSSIDRLIGFASISQRNFDIKNFPTFTGGGQNLSLRGEFGFVRSNYLLSWTDPWILGFPYSFGFDLYRTTHARETGVGYGWEEERWGGNLRLGKEFTDWFRTDLIYRLDRVRISDMPDDIVSDIRDEEGTNFLSSLGGYITFDTRDNVFNPKRGFLIKTGLEGAGGPFLGDFNFIKYTAGAKYYIGFMDTFVIELRLRGGVVGEYGGSDRVPVYERFYAGGSGVNSIRGYSERGVGPRDKSTEDPIGGESVVVGGTEVTFPIWKGLIKGAFFYDFGNVWAQTGDIGFTDYKSGAGIGIRVKTPIGPVKLDWGYPLTEQEGEDQKGRFYFSISQGF